MIAILILMFMSMGIVYSASSTWAMEKFGESEKVLISHAIKVFLGIILLFAGMMIDYHAIKRYTKPALVGAIVLLCITLVLGGEVKGAQRFLRFASLGFQPSEFAKYALLFHLCVLITVKGNAVRNFKRGSSRSSRGWVS